MKEEILKILGQARDISLTIMELNDRLGLKSKEDLKMLEYTLNQMEKEGLLYYSKRKDKYLLLENSHLVKGIIELKAKGYAFLTQTNLDSDVYISKDNLNNAFDGDLVAVEITDKVKNEGKVIRILRKNETSLVGEVINYQGKLHLKPNNKNLPLMTIPNSKLKGLVDGYVVLFRRINEKEIDIIKIIGHRDDIGIDELKYLYEYGFEPDFNDMIKEEVKNIPMEVNEKDFVNRKDLRDKMIFTIDGSDTKDIDDAISLENNVLGVHIADVSNYVKVGSAIFNRAYNNATSVYMPGNSVPMLPRELSNGICSLNPLVDRLAVSCDMKVDDNGKIIDYDVYLSVIRSKKKMTYEAVNQILEEDKVPSDYLEFKDKLKEMDILAKKVAKRMEARGYIDFNRPEIKVIMDDEGKPIEIGSRCQRSGEKLIETFMIMANESVLEYLTNVLGIGLYRVHDVPNEERIESLFKFVALRGAVLNGKINKEHITAKSLINILEQLKDDPALTLVKDLMIRSMSKAYYSSENIGHYGLGSRCYGHFTSPIRRLPDLIIHILVKLSLNDYDEEEIAKWESALEDYAVQSSKKERDADNVEREVTKMRTAEYMENHIGEIYEGTISSITNFGMFVELDNLVEGLIKIEDLTDDYYDYVPDLFAMVGQKTKKRYMLGDRVTVKVIGASKEQAQIDFMLVEGGAV